MASPSRRAGRSVAMANRPELGEGGSLRPVVDLLVEQVGHQTGTMAVMCSTSVSGAVVTGCGIYVCNVLAA